MNDVKNQFKTNEFLMANGSTMLMDTAIVLFSRAVEFGKAGAVQSIQESKSVVQTVLEVLVMGSVPNAGQISGMVVGLIGVTVIVL